MKRMFGLMVGVLVLLCLTGPVFSAKKKVAIVIFEGVELLDFAGPGEVFAAAGRGGAFDVFTVGPTAAAIESQRFVTVTPEVAMAQSPWPDVLVIPGGNVGSLLEDEAAKAWLRKAATQAELVLSVCNGALVLADAGLLDGLEATTHHGSIATLKQMAPRTKVHDDRRFVDNGKIITAAGVSAGIDAALHVVSRLLGVESAQRTAYYMEYAWEPEAARAAGLVATGR